MKLDLNSTEKKSQLIIVIGVKGGNVKNQAGNFCYICLAIESYFSKAEPLSNDLFQHEFPGSVKKFNSFCYVNLQYQTLQLNKDLIFGL